MELSGHIIPTLCPGTMASPVTHSHPRWVKCLPLLPAALVSWKEGGGEMDEAPER